MGSGGLGVLTRAACLASVMFAMIAPAASAELFFVNSLADDAANTGTDNCIGGVGPGDVPATPGNTCTFRGAINAAIKQTAEFDLIEFEVGLDDPIVVKGELPPIPGSTFVNGYAPCDPIVNDGNPPAGCALGHDHVEIQGPGAPFPGAQAPYDGLTFVGSGSGGLGLEVNGFHDGIVLAGSGPFQVYDSEIGTDFIESGPGSPPNTDDGVEVKSGSAGDIVGLLPADGDDTEYDVIGGNGGWGVHLDPGSGPTSVVHTRIGTSGTGLAIPNGLGGVLVESDGNLIGGTADCVDPDSHCNRNVISGNAGPGIRLAPGTRDNVIAGNFVGTGPDGLSAVANQGPGIDVAGTEQTIGGPQPAAANVVAGNRDDGIVLRGTSATVEGDRVGVGDDGTTPVANGGAGIRATDEDGADTGASTVRGVIAAGNAGAGIELDQGGNRVLGSTVGRPGAANAVGIHVTRSDARIGTLNAVNDIEGNTGAGVLIDGGLPGAPPTGVSVEYDTIADNGGLGIDLSGDGVTPNDPADADAGPNGLTNWPRLSAVSAAGGALAYHGSLDAAPSTTYQLHLVSSPACDASGYGEGATTIAGGNVITDAQGHADFGALGPGSVPAGAAVAATVRGPDGSSEFGPCSVATGGVDLQLTQSAVGDVTAGRSAELVVHLANAGPAPATSVLLTDRPPAGVTVLSPPSGCTAPADDGSFRCPIGALAAGESRDLHVLLQPAAEGALANAASVASDQIELADTDNRSTFGGTAGAVSTGPGGGGPTGEGTSVNEVRPEFGETLRVDPQRGTLTATLPDGRKIRISDFAIVPVGTTVDATDVRAKVTARRADGTTVHAVFFNSPFVITQRAKGTGLVQARLSRRLDCAGRSGRASASGGKKHHKRRDLWGHAHGPFRIKGRYGAAAARGTRWHVVDRCTFTRVHVTEGVVDVRAVGARTRPRTAQVAAGESVVLRP